MYSAEFSSRCAGEIKAFHTKAEEFITSILFASPEILNGAYPPETEILSEDRIPGDSKQAEEIIRLQLCIRTGC